MPGSGSPTSPVPGTTAGTRRSRRSLEVDPGDTRRLRDAGRIRRSADPQSTAADVRGRPQRGASHSPGPSSCKVQSPVTCSRPSSSRSSPTRGTSGATRSRSPASASCATSSRSRTSSTGSCTARATPSRRSCPACAFAAAPSRARSGSRRAASCAALPPRARPSWRRAAASRSRRTRGRRPIQRAGSAARGCAPCRRARPAGNIDIKQTTPGVTLLLPVHVEGALVLHRRRPLRAGRL